MVETDAAWLGPAIVEGIFTVIAVALGGLIALWSYRRQKEYELVKERYLDGSIDVVASELEHVFGVMSHNWARCLQLVGAYRDQQGDFHLNELSSGFLPLDASRFQRIAHARLRTLIGSKLIWRLYQLATAHCVHTNDRFTKGIPDVIRLKFNTDRIKRTHKELADEAVKELWDLNAGALIATDTSYMNCSRSLTFWRRDGSGIATWGVFTGVGT